MADFPLVSRAEELFGQYWCATESRLVGYESRLELTRLVMADFDVAAKRIVSQPFRLTGCWRSCTVLSKGRWIRMTESNYGPPKDSLWTRSSVCRPCTSQV